VALVRKDHWATRSYHQFLIDNKDKTFEWGSWDCTTFCANAIEAMTGVDIADEVRGKYTTAIGAMKLIKSLTGGTTVADAVAYCAQKHGLPELEKPKFAKRGDVVVIKNGDDLIAGMVHLNGRHVICVSETGLVRLSIENVQRAWSV